MSLNPHQYSTSQVADIPNYVSCYGILLVSERFKFIGTNLLITGIMTNYYILCAPCAPTNQAVALITVASILHALSVWFMFAVVRKDPGMIPKIYCDYEQEALMNIPVHYRCITYEPVMIPVYIMTTPYQSHYAKWCSTCQIFRPPRTIHCPTCNVCIQRFDHHCPWLGTCIGRNNYPLFYAFITLLTLLFIIILAHAISLLARQRMSIAQGGSLIAVFGIATTLLGVLNILHIFLSLRNSTTNEFFRNRWDSLTNPFSKQSPTANWLKLLFLSPSMPMRALPQTMLVRRASHSQTQHRLTNMTQENASGLQ